MHLYATQIYYLSQLQPKCMLQKYENAFFSAKMWRVSQRSAVKSELFKAKHKKLRKKYILLYICYACYTVIHTHLCYISQKYALQARIAAKRC